MKMIMMMMTRPMGALQRPYATLHRPIPSFIFVGSGFSNWCHITTHLVLVLVVLLVLVVAAFFKKCSRLRHLIQIGWGWNLASIHGVGFLLWRHTFQTAAMMSCHAEKWCHPMSANAASARCICSSVRHLMIRSTFKIVVSIGWV